MKKKEKQTMQSMSQKDLQELVRKEKHALAEYMTNRYSKQSKNVKQAWAHRRKLAVAKTMLRLKELTNE